MAEFPNQNHGIVSGPPLTPIPQAPIVMQPQVQMQQPIPPQQVQTAEVKPRHKNKNTLFGLGISEVVFGSISVIFGIVTLIIAGQNPRYRSNYSSQNYYYYYNHGFTWASQGIWCGLFLIATGILGIKAKSNPSVCMYRANMAMSIISANIMVPFMTLSGIAAALASEGYSRSDHLQSLIVLHSILVIVGFAAAVVCIVHSVYCCAGVCCRHTPYSGPVNYTSQPYGVQQPQQMVMLANGQYMLVPVQPGVPQSYPVMPNPMVAGQVVYQPPQSGGIMPQTTMTGQAQFFHPTAVYPPFGSQQPVQVTTATNWPPQHPTSNFPPAVSTQLATDVNKDQASVAAAEAPPSYSLHQNEQDRSA